jgi:integrase/recombinase XerD
VRPNDQRTFVIDGLSREHWADAAPVRAIFKVAFAGVELPYFKPHSVRNTLTQLAYTLKLSPEQLKAWSQNMGHDSVLTTIGSYGPISVERQQELLNALGKPISRLVISRLRLQKRSLRC